MSDESVSPRSSRPLPFFSPQPHQSQEVSHQIRHRRPLQNPSSKPKDFPPPCRPLDSPNHQSRLRLGTCFLSTALHSLFGAHISHSSSFIPRNLPGRMLQLKSRRLSRNSTHPLNRQLEDSRRSTIRPFPPRSRLLAERSRQNPLRRRRQVVRRRCGDFYPSQRSF